MRQMKRVMTDRAQRESRDANKADSSTGVRIVSALVFRHLPNDWSLRSGLVKWILSCYSMISCSGSYCHGVCDSLSYFIIIIIIFPRAVLSIYVRKSCSFVFRTMNHQQSHRGLLTPCEELGVAACCRCTMKPSSTCILLRQMHLYPADDIKHSLWHSYLCFHIYLIFNIYTLYTCEDLNCQAF